MLMTCGEGLVEAIQENQDDWVRYLVAADWYEDEGDEEMVVALRWMWEKHSRPTRLNYHAPTHGALWVWSDVSYAKGKLNYPNSLLAMDVARAIGIDMFGCWYSWEKAVRALGKGLNKLISPE